VNVDQMTPVRKDQSNGSEEEEDATEDQVDDLFGPTPPEGGSPFE
jgi:hypothetical protein